MALTIQENKDATQDLVKADRRMWLDADGKAVEDGDPTARMLFCAAGQMVPRAAAEAAGVKFAGKAKAKKKAPAKKKS